MDQQTLLTVMTVFVCISAIALLIQAWMLSGIYRATRSMQDNMQRLLPKIESLIDTSRQTIEDSRKQILDITSKTSDILEIARKQMERVDEVLEDATARAHVQLERAEMVVDDVMERAHSTVAVVHTGIMKPLREIQGVAAALRAAIQFLMRGRPNPTHATSDEEMFI
jgi:cell division protein FtsL